MLSEQDKKTLLEIARASVKSGLQHDCPLSVDPNTYPEHLRTNKATFVTLNINNQLRGCIGTLQARQPLVNDVAEHAYAAAFRDPRFRPMTEEEFPELQFHISILGETEPLEFSSEQDLLEQMRPGIDGLVLSDGFHKGTFLPSVWESLPTPVEFLRHLKQKAGLPPDYWSDSIRVERYTVEEF
jgi:AmmeMemoRadiSam system protein A